MRRCLEYVNLIGVLALVALCMSQWQIDRALNLKVNQLEKVRNDQVAKLKNQAQSLQDVQDDLAQFKTAFAHEEKSRTEAEHKFSAAEQSSQQLTLEREQLKSSLSNWVSAVAIRDERIKEANTRIGQLSDDLNASVRKFNELATNYNTVVKSFTEPRAHSLAPPDSILVQPQPGPARKP